MPDVSSSILGFLDADFNCYSASPGEKQVSSSEKFFHGIFMAFLKTSKAKTPQATLLKSAFWKKDDFLLHYVYVGKDWELGGQWVQNSSLF